MYATRSARRAARIVTSGSRHLTALKRSAARYNRRAVRQALRGGADDVGTVGRLVSAYDVS